MEELMQIARQYEDTNYGIDHPECEIYQRYSLETEEGRAFYEQIKDEVLLQILKEKAENLGYSPSQKEVFWVWRDYIKERFQKWPYALQAAGLSKSAGKGGKELSKFRKEQEVYEALLETVREKAKRLCRIPHPQELPEVSCQIVKYAKSWGQVILEAGIDERFFQKYAVYKVENLERADVQALVEVQELAEKLHRAPFKEELSKETKQRLLDKFGSYRNALYQIGMEPSKRRNPFHMTELDGEMPENKKTHQRDSRHCYYQVLNIDSQTREDLDVLYEIWKKTGKVPERKKIDVELRKRLQKSCGSWANALYQLQNRIAEEETLREGDFASLS